MRPHAAVSMNVSTHFALHQALLYAILIRVRICHLYCCPVPAAKCPSTAVIVERLQIAA